MQYSANVPCRSISFPLVSSHAPISAVRLLLGAKWACRGWVLWVAPRIWTAALSLITDRMVARISAAAALPVGTVLTVWSSSWTVFLFHTRPFSNTYECFWLIATIFAVFAQAHNAAWRRNLIFGMIVGAAVFTRVTFLFYAFPLGLALLHKNWGYAAQRDSSGRRFITLNLLWTSQVLAGILTTALPIIMMDSAYFKTLYADNWTLLFTPWHLFLFNSSAKNLEQFGLHPRITHLALNMQMLFGPLFLLLLSTLVHSKLQVVPYSILAKTAHKTAHSHLAAITGVAAEFLAISAGSAGFDSGALVSLRPAPFGCKWVAVSFHGPSPGGAFPVAGCCRSDTAWCAIDLEKNTRVEAMGCVQLGDGAVLGVCASGCCHSVVAQFFDHSLKHR
jgi:hypothetical protein